MNIDTILDKLVDKLMNLDSSVDLEQSKETEKIGIFKRDFGMEHFDWPQGVGLLAIYRLYEITQDKKYFDYLDNWFESKVKAHLPSKNINTTIPVYTLLQINKVVNKPHYSKVIKEYRDFLMYDLPRTTEGGFEHITSSKTSGDEIMRHEEQLWVDTFFMSVLFLNAYAHQYKDEEALNEASYQLKLHIKYLFNSNDSLFYHGYTFKDNNNFADCYWGRGNCWMTLGLPIFLNEGEAKAEIKNLATNTLKAQVKRLYEINDNGMYHTVLDDPTSYLESSGTAGIIAGILQAINMGLIEDDHKEVIINTINELSNNIDADGNLLEVSCGTGIYKNKEDYKHVVKRPMAYGQSLVILALLEYKKYLNK